MAKIPTLMEVKLEVLERRYREALKQRKKRRKRRR